MQRYRGGMVLSGIIAGMVLALALAPVHAAGDKAEAAVFTTPLGITLQPIGNNRPKPYGVFSRRAHGVAFADDNGMALYVSDKDEPGISHCLDDCAKAWPPARVLPEAKAGGDWSIVTRPDGVKQWAYRGQPLYTSVTDEEPGDSNAKEAGWRTAFFKADVTMPLPAGVGVKEVMEAQALVLVDQQGFTLYASEGKAAPSAGPSAASCPAESCETWRPFVAPALARPMGDFTVIARADGIKQWAFRKRPLFTYSGDLKPGDAAGNGVDRFAPAVVVRHFMPPGVAPRLSDNHGVVLTAADGMTLYARNGYLYQNGGYHMRDGVFMIPTMGRAVGRTACADCGQAWKPLRAPDGAKPSGYWEVAGPAGAKQWAYKGYPVYTYAGDKAPGDVLGAEKWDIQVNTSGASAKDPVFVTDNATGIYWFYVFP